MIISPGHFRISISWWFVILIPAVVLTGNAIPYLTVYISIILHELGHAVVGMILHASPYFLEISPLGLRLSIRDGHLSKNQALAVYFAGPTVNILLAGIIYGISCISGMEGTYLINKSEYLKGVVVFNLCLAGFNMIPAIPLDGGRILQIMLSGEFGLIAASRYLKLVAAVLSACFTIYGLYGLVNASAGFIHLNMVFAGVYLIFSLFTMKGEASLMNMKQIIYRKSRLKRRGIYAARDLVVMKSLRLAEVIKYMDYDMFHFIYVLDDDLKLLGIINENEIFDSMVNHHTVGTFEELILSTGGGLQFKSIQSDYSNPLY